MKQVLAGLFALLTGFSIAASARDLTAAEKQSDLNQMVARLKSGYGPLMYKKSRGIDLDSIAQVYSDKIANTRTNGEFYYQMIRFIAEFKDGHFSANLPTTHVASLPITVDLVQGKILIDEIKTDKMPKTNLAFVRGDEIVEFAGRPAMEVVEELMTFVPNGYELSVRRLATMALTVRSGTRMPIPTEKNVTLKIRHGDSNVLDEVTVDWAFEGEPLDEMEAPTEKPPFRKLNRPSLMGDFADISTFSEMALYENPQMERSFRCSGKTRIEIPKDATVIMKEPFVAYYYPTAKGNVGYLRIPHYSPSMEEPKETDAYELRFAKYEYAVSVLEEKTVGLVIDQQHNCGGSVGYLHQIGSLFMTEDFKPIQFELLGNKEEYLSFKKWITDRYKDTLEYLQYQKVLNLVKEAWEKGTGMTPKTALDAAEVVGINKVHYTKPIVMLIDEVSGSGGDAFPALLQGNGRAVLIGERTMGLGGHVVEQTPLHYSQITPRITKSLFYHPNGTPIENNGASPDVPYQPSRNDFMYGYREFQAFYTDELLKRIQ